VERRDKEKERWKNGRMQSVHGMRVWPFIGKAILARFSSQNKREMHKRKNKFWMTTID